MRARQTPGLVGVLLLLVLGGLAPSAAWADSVATTGEATSVTGSSSLLNGLIDPSYLDSAWFFEYSSSPTLGTGLKVLRPDAAGPGVRAVSGTVTGLSPGTTYYFRVAVVSYPDTTQAPVVHYGQVESFATTTDSRTRTGSVYGTVALVSRTLKLSGGSAGIVLVCHGAARSLCAAKLTLSAVRAHHRAVGCGRGTFIAAPPRRHTVRVRPSRSCLSLLESAKGHRLAAVLSASFSTDQKKLTQKVTLVR